MSRRMTADPATHAEIATVRPEGGREVHLYGEDAIGPGHVASIRDALKEGVTVAFFMARGDARPMFRLRGYQGVVHVVDHEGRHLGTFADISAAEDRGWRFGLMPWEDEAAEVKAKRVRRRKAG